MEHKEIKPEGTPSTSRANNVHASNTRVNNGPFMDDTAFLDKVFSNSANKLKRVSKVQFVLGCLISLVAGISIWDDWGLQWLFSILIWILGPTLTYIHGLLLYAFAQMADDISAARKSCKT